MVSLIILLMMWLTESMTALQLLVLNDPATKFLSYCFLINIVMEFLFGKAGNPNVNISFLLKNFFRQL